MVVSRARLYYTFIGSQKMQAIADLVRGKNVQEALNILKFMNKKGARILSKVIHSAVSNADQKGNVDIDNLTVAQVDVGNGMQHYRVRPRARGSAAWIRKKTSHVAVSLEEK